ncbi:hypothetical protein ACU635_14165 [[Actinomadura] parvosata]|uniref:hypothetical protein n=1 Tax=[Actinomadura] parvosata TaxID=1955412 RepID=UPI00406C9BEC
MTRLLAFLAVLAVVIAASWRIYLDHKPLGVIVFTFGMILFVLIPYYRLMGITHDDEPKG